MRCGKQEVNVGQVKETRKIKKTRKETTGEKKQERILKSKRNKRA